MPRTILGRSFLLTLLSDRVLHLDPVAPVQVSVLTMYEINGRGPLR